MKVQQLMQTCRESGVSIHIVDGSVKLRGAPKAVHLARGLLHPHKLELLAMFTTEGCGAVEIWGSFTPYTCPANVHSDTVRELHDLIEKYGLAYRIADSELARIRSAALRQPASTVAESIKYFKQAIR